MNRLEIVVYAKILADTKKDTEFLKTIEENREKNNYPGDEDSITFLGGEIDGKSWKNKAPFNRIYNPIGKYFMNIIVPSQGIIRKYESLEKSQDYIRHTLLGIPEES